MYDKKRAPRVYICMHTTRNVEQSKNARLQMVRLYVHTLIYVNETFSAQSLNDWLMPFSLNRRSFINYFLDVLAYFHIHIYIVAYH